MKKIILLSVIGIIFLSEYGVYAVAKNEPTTYNMLNHIDDYDMVIIAPLNFSQPLQPLIEHKTTYGVTTFLKTTEEIYAEYNGRDPPEQIKYYLEDAQKTHNIQYVLLVGGKSHVPVRFATAYISPGGLSLEGTPSYTFVIGSLSSSAKYISDLYYADLYTTTGEFCTWDANNNSIFGEVDGETNIDNVDLTPDIAIGRLLCQNQEEVEQVVTKIITYETKTYGTAWFNNLILCGGDTHPNSFTKETLFCMAIQNATGIPCRCAWEGEYESDLIADLLDTVQAKKFYSTGFFGLRAQPLTTGNINTAISEGAGFLYFNLHGSPTLMLTYPPFNSKHTIPLPYPGGYTRANVQQLTNGDKLPIAVFCSCSTGDFTKTVNPFAWEFVKHESGGSIASFACTTVGLVLPGTLSSLVWTGTEAINVFEAYADGSDILGEVWKETLTRFLEDEVAWGLHEIFMQSVLWANYLSVENWMLFGDPSLKIGGYP